MIAVGRVPLDAWSRRLGSVAPMATKEKRWPIAGPSVCLLANG